MGSRALAVLLIVAAGTVVFANSLPNGFHLDDFFRVAHNDGIRELHPVWRHFADPGTMSEIPRITQYRPLLPLTLSINYRLHGLDLPGYHIGNLIAHLLSSLLVYALCRELLTHWTSGRYGPRTVGGMSLAAALMFAIHPVSGIVVNYVCARDLALMQTFLLASILTYVRMRRMGATVLRWVAVILLVAISMLAKTNPVAAPFLILAFEFTVARKGLLSGWAWLRALPFAVVAGAFFLLTKVFLDFSDLGKLVPEREISFFIERGMVQTRVHLTHYLANFFWPFAVRLCAAPGGAAVPTDPGFLCGAAVIGSSLVAAVVLARRCPLLSWCILGYWILLAPTSSVVPFHQVVAHYRPYVASPFFYLAVTIVAVLALRRAPRAPVVLLVVVYLGAASIFMNTLWRTEESLWAHSVRYGGTSLAHMNYAQSLSDRTDPRVRHHLERALEMSPNYVLAHVNLGIHLINAGETEEGLERLRRTVRTYPTWVEAPYWLGRMLHRAGKYDEAVEAFRRAEGARPGFRETRFRLGFALQKAGRNEEAVSAYRQHLEEAPDDYQARFNLAYALMETGEHAEAVRHFTRTLELRPEYREVHLHLATCYEALGRADDAARERALYE